MTWTRRILVGCAAMVLLAGCGSAAHARSAPATTATTKAATTKPAKTQTHKKVTAKVVRHTAATTAPRATTTTAPPTTVAATTTTTAPPAQHLPAVSFDDLPVPSGYTCASGLYFVAPANQAGGQCLPYAYLIGGTTSDPNHNTACPTGSTMTMGPAMCIDASGIVTPVPPGTSLPYSILAWSAVQFPTGTCPAGYYSGDTNGIATCVPSGYLLSGDSTCPTGSALRIDKLTGSLCTEETAPYDIVAPVPA